MPVDDNYWRGLIKRAVKEMLEEAERTRDFIVTEAWDAFTEAAPPEERAAAYANVNWDRLATLSPQMFHKLARDAMRLNSEFKPGPRALASNAGAISSEERSIARNSAEEPDRTVSAGGNGYGY